MTTTTNTNTIATGNWGLNACNERQFGAMLCQHHPPPSIASSVMNAPAAFYTISHIRTHSHMHTAVISHCVLLSSFALWSFLYLVLSPSLLPLSLPFIWENNFNLRQLTKTFTLILHWNSQAETCEHTCSASLYSFIMLHFVVAVVIVLSFSLWIMATFSEGY